MIKIKSYRRIYRICPKKYDNKSWMNRIPKNLSDMIADPPKRKKCLSEDEVKALLNGHVIIEEKIDGGVLGIAWDGNIPLVVGKHSMVNYDVRTKRFYGLTEWIYENYEKISKIPLGWIVYGEWMRASHKIYYNELPDYFIGFDIWDGNKFFSWNDKSSLLDVMGFEKVPVRHSGFDLDIVDIIYLSEGMKVLNNKSEFNSNETIEGVIIRNDNGLTGKYVRKKFDDSIEEHWLTLPLVENKLTK